MFCTYVDELRNKLRLLKEKRIHMMYLCILLEICLEGSIQLFLVLRCGNLDLELKQDQNGVEILAIN